MKILLVNNYFIPEIGAASHLYYYLGKELVKRGHEVYVLTGIPRYNVAKEVYSKYLKKDKLYIEEIDGLKILRVKLPYISRNKFFRRGIEHFEIAYKLYMYSKKVIKNLKIDVSLIYSPPLTLYWTGLQFKKKFNIPFVFNVQDLFPQEVIDLGLLKNKFIIKFFRKMEKKTYEVADIITVHSQKNKDFVVSVCKTPEKVFVVENWINEEEIKPGEKINHFSQKYDLVGKFVVSFAGTMGVFQDINVIVNAANELKEYKDIKFIIVGDGIKKEESKKLAEKLNLNNVMFLPMVSKEEYPFVLHSSDVSLATLDAQLKTPPVPSKILSIMSAGIPVVATVNLEGDAPELIKKANCGYVFPAGDYKSLANAILELYKNEKLRKELGKNGRKYIEENLSVKKAADIYEEIFKKIL